MDAVNINAKQTQGQSTISMPKLDFGTQDTVSHIHEFMLKTDGLITNWNVLYQAFEKKYGKLKLKIADKERLFSSMHLLSPAGPAPKPQKLLMK